MKKNVLLIIFCAWSSLILSAQNQDAAPVYRLYSTQKWHSQVRQLPDVADSMSAIERYNYQFRTYGVIDSVQVPVVLHLMPLPSGATPITAADIQTQLDRLNEDFMTPRHPYLAENYQRPALVYDEQGAVIGSQTDLQTYLIEADKAEHFAERAGNPSIRFCLAAIDPDGLPTTGVVQPTTTAQLWATGDSIMRHADGSRPWATDRYLNIWVARLDSMSGAGWAQMPGGPATSDGIVIDDRVFVRANRAGQANVTLSHLAASYLNLYELWSDTEPCADDYVDDTPIHNAPNYGLDQYAYRHVSTCDGNPVEMLSNIMDNAADSIQYLFTWGQVVRMQATLSADGPRRGLRQTATACGQVDGLEGIDDREADAQQMANRRWTAQIAPNPANGRFGISLQSSSEESKVDVAVYDALGHLVWQSAGLATDLNGQLRVQVDGQPWARGIYSVVIWHAGQQQALRLMLAD
jgi:hypothetical protein